MILVFGSLNMDLILEVPALPAPGETVLSQRYLTKPGGKGGNQAVAAARAGADVMMVGRVGEDEFGRRLVANLRDNGVAAANVGTADEPTGIACICVDPQGENSIAVASGANLAATLHDVPEASLGLGIATVLMQMEVRPEENWALIRHAHESGALSLLNVAPAAPVPRAALERLDVLVVNEKEAAALAGSVGGDPEGPEALARALAGIGQLTGVVTLGRRGAIAAHGGEVWAVDALPWQPVDTTGAGDAFTGILAAALDSGLKLPEALRRASVGAGLACQALGAQESLPVGTAIDANIARIPPPRRLV